MDLSKYPLEKFFSYIAGIIPGFVALLIYHLAARGSFGWFFTLGFLGYRTKLSLIVLAAFIVGNTMTIFLNTFLGALGGVIGAVIARRPYKPPHSYDVAPWRDARWRVALKNHLGSQAPNDTRPFSQALLDIRRQMVEYLPESERPMALAKLNSEKLSAEMDDSNWAQWYDHYHQIILSPDQPSTYWYVHRGLTFNLETAALYVLISAAVVSAVRRWWCILPACMWVLMLVAESYSDYRRVTEKWSTLSAQIKYLSEGGDRAAASERPSKP